MNFRRLLILALIVVAMSQDTPNIIDGKYNDVRGDGGNVVTGNGKIIRAVDPTTVSDDLKKLDDERKFMVDTPVKSAGDRTAALQSLMNTILKTDFGSTTSKDCDPGFPLPRHVN